jgi:hypothetical protein
MLSPISSQAIAPATLLRGQGAWDEALPRLPQLCQRPLLLGRSMATQILRDQLSSDLEAVGLTVTAQIFDLIVVKSIFIVLPVKPKPVMQFWLPVAERFLMQESCLLTA